MTPFVHEKMHASESRSHGRVWASSSHPPHRSTTLVPATLIDRPAPSSSPFAKFAANASRTAANRVSHVPLMVMSAMRGL